MKTIVKLYEEVKIQLQKKEDELDQLLEDELSTAYEGHLVNK